MLRLAALLRLAADAPQNARARTACPECAQFFQPPHLPGPVGRRCVPLFLPSPTLLDLVTTYHLQWDAPTLCCCHATTQCNTQCNTCDTDCNTQCNAHPPISSELVKTYHLSEEDDMMLRKVESEYKTNVLCMLAQSTTPPGPAPPSYPAMHALTPRPVLRHAPCPPLCSSQCQLQMRALGWPPCLTRPCLSPPCCAASGVSWKAGKDVTVKLLKKKPKPGEAGMFAVCVLTTQWLTTWGRDVTVKVEEEAQAGWEGQTDSRRRRGRRCRCRSCCCCRCHRRCSSLLVLRAGLPCVWDASTSALSSLLRAGSKGGKPQTKTEPVESFFRWFTEVPEVRALLFLFRVLRFRSS